MIYIDDVHSRLCRTKIRSIVRVNSVEDIQRSIRRCRERRWKLSIAGGRHSMGGQSFVTDGVMLDMRSFCKVLSFDREWGIIRMEGGAMWPDIKRYLGECQELGD